MKKLILILNCLCLLCISCNAGNKDVVNIVKQGVIENYPGKKISDAVEDSLTSFQYRCFGNEEGTYVAIDGYVDVKKLASVYANSPFVKEMNEDNLSIGEIEDNIFNGLSELSDVLISYVFNVNADEKTFVLQKVVFDGEEVLMNAYANNVIGNTMVGILFGDPNTFLLVFDMLTSNTVQTSSIPTSPTSSGVMEIFEWYTSLGLIESVSSDKVHASVKFDIALAYDKDDTKALAEIEDNKNKIKKIVGSYISTKTTDVLRYEEELLISEIKNEINDKVFGNSIIKDVAFQQKDVTIQN